MVRGTRDAVDGRVTVGDGMVGAVRSGADCATAPKDRGAALAVATRNRLNNAHLVRQLFISISCTIIVFHIYKII